MSSSDWTVLTNSLNSSTIARGVSAGFTPPAGGGSFVYGMHSLLNTTGGLGLYVNLANFSPMAKGGLISGAVQKKGGGGNTNHAPILFIGLQSNDIASLGYLLGIAQDDPAHLILRKGSLVGGLPDVPVGSQGVLARSTATYTVGAWAHIRLEMVANTSGDVVLNVYENDLDANDVDAPVWEAIAGMKDFPGGVEATAFIDDALGVNSGSLPYTSGRVGFAGRFSDISRVCLVDHVVCERQL